MKVNGKVFVVTGAGNGIGREVAILLLAKGATVAGVDRNAEGLNETKRLAGISSEKFSVHVTDITDQEAVKVLPDEIADLHGHIDGLINNAGIIQKFVSVDEIAIEQMKRIMDVNFYGALFMIKAFLPYLEKNTESQIVNVSSMGGFLPVPQQTIYGASKAAVKMLTEGLQSELKGTNIHVSLVMPGGVSTGIMETAGIDTKKLMSSKIARSYRMMTPSSAARRIVRGVERNKKRLILGTDAKAMDILYRINPNLASFIMERMLNVKRYL
jgi:short-subunit dehydrogenase